MHWVPVSRANLKKKQKTPENISRNVPLLPTKTKQNEKKKTQTTRVNIKSCIIMRVAPRLSPHLLFSRCTTIPYVCQADEQDLIFYECACCGGVVCLLKLSWLPLFFFFPFAVTAQLFFGARVAGLDIPHHSTSLQ
jgi:hypothetical protein